MSSTREKPVESAWSGSKQKKEEPLFGRPAGDFRTMERSAIERWENEGGEISKDRPEHVATINEYR